jgi:putative intracellular protease/amidase
MNRKIAYLYAFEGLADWEIGYLAAELASRRYLNGPAEAPELRTFGKNRGEIVTMGGLRVTSDLSLGEIRAEDAALLVLPGGDSWTNYRDHDGIAKLAAAFLEAGIPVAAICGATFSLARAGLLDARCHTSNDLGYLKAVAPGYRGEKLYREEGAVADGPLITASGLASLEFARETLRALEVMKKETLDAWYELNRTRSSAQYYALEASLQKESA